MLSGKDMVQELHRHDFYYILVIEKGTGQHDIDFNSYPVTDQSLFIMRPGQVHQIVLDTKSMGYLLQFREEFFLPPDKASKLLLHKACQFNHYQISSVRFQKLVTLMNYIFEENQAQQQSAYEAIRAAMNLFFIELIRQNDDSSNGTDAHIQGHLERFLDLLETNIATHRPVSEYARMLNLSVYQLNSVVKSALGKPTSVVISERLVLEAKRYLLATSNQINETAYLLGYDDVSYFIRFFKKHTGYTPDAFRQNFR
jgi:AraC family transcriptional activator of pobA